jgi:endonuclease/exonuclease/phosphatase family metal-dependent hydrolase
MCKQFVIVLSLLSLVLSCSSDDRSLHIASFNIRYDNPDDGINAWSERKKLVESFLANGDYDIIGFQEVLKNQLDDLSQMLPNYQYVAAGRDDGKDAGEHCPIFYNPTKYDLLANSHFWLSEQPEVPGSVGWGAHLPRIVTWAKLKNSRSGHIFFVFNTHLSHVNEYARNESIILLLNKIKTLADNIPVVITGDFNMMEEEQAYKTVTGNWHGYFPFSDAQLIAKRNATTMPNTYNGFTSKTGKSRIDYIFVNGYFGVQEYEKMEITDGERFISDHYPIRAHLIFNSDRENRHGENNNIPQYAPAPTFETSHVVFQNRMEIPISAKDGMQIFYTTDGSEPDTSSLLYLPPLVIDRTTTIQAMAWAPELIPSPAVKQTFIKCNERFCELKQVKPEAYWKYNSTGYESLFDGLLGSEQLNDGSWLGFKGQDVTFEIRRTTDNPISKVFVSMLEDQTRWVFLPKAIQVFVSHDGLEYESFGQVSITHPLERNPYRSSRMIEITGSAQCSFVKIVLSYPGPCPEWHDGDGSPSWLFVDEIAFN